MVLNESAKEKSNKNNSNDKRLIKIQTKNQSTDLTLDSDFYKNIFSSKLMQAYKPYVEYITAGGVAETAYILSKEGAICATSLPIQQLPQYHFDLEDDQGKTTKIVVDERVNLLEAITNKGPCPKHPEGIRLYNQKYYPVNFEEQKDSFTKFYLKKSQGGACICITKNLILIGTFNSQTKMQNGVPQNPGELNKRVQQLAKNLFNQGY